MIIQLVIFASPGFKGNEWTANNLQKKGYVFDCSIDAKNKTEALIVVNKSIISNKLYEVNDL